MLSAERNYYRRRAEQEASAAERASTPQAQHAHRELAERYAAKLQLLESISAGTPYPPAVRSPEHKAA